MPYRALRFPVLVVRHSRPWILEQGGVELAPNDTRSPAGADLSADLVQLNRVSTPHLLQDRPASGATTLTAGHILMR
jgi:hypothetical protein